MAYAEAIDATQLTDYILTSKGNEEQTKTHQKVELKAKDDSYCAGGVLVEDINIEEGNNREHYKSYIIECYKKGNYSLGVQGGFAGKITTTTQYPDGTTSSNIKDIGGASRIGDFKNGTSHTVHPSLNPIYDYKWVFTTNVPLFKKREDLMHYVNTGDDSNTIIDLSTKWNLFIDGAQNPLYKLTWNCKGINSKDVSNSFVKLWIGKYDSFLGTVSNISPFKEIDYSKGECKISFADISKLVEQPTIGHNPACLLMQLGYRKFVTARIETSTKMGVDLYFDKSSIQTMYDNLGYFTTEDGVIKKTSSGDGSTLTVQDGQEGSNGYTSDDDGGYDDGKDNDDADGDTTDISAGIGVLTTTFKMTKERLQQLGQFLWSSSIFDKFSLINNNPIENIVSCKAIPIEKSGSNQQIVLGNVETGVNGEKISNNFGNITIGSVTISEYYKNFLDYSPYTNVIIYLPYIGFRELDTSMIMGKTLKVEYTTDCITGGCLAQISVGGVRLYEFTGNMGIDIPITASNRAQVEAGYIQAGVGAAMSLTGGNIAGATTALINSATAQYHYSSTGNPSPMCVASTNRTCYVVIDRPQFQKLKAFNHTRGQKCNLSKTIGSLKGFTICDSNIDLSGVSATETEKEEIVNILSTGFFA